MKLADTIRITKNHVASTKRDQLLVIGSPVKFNEEKLKLYIAEGVIVTGLVVSKSNTPNIFSAKKKNTPNIFIYFFKA